MSTYAWAAAKSVLAGIPSNNIAGTAVDFLNGTALHADRKLLEELAAADAGLQAARTPSSQQAAGAPPYTAGAEAHGLHAFRCLALLLELIGECQVSPQCLAACMRLARHDGSACCVASPGSMNPLWCDVVSLSTLRNQWDEV